MATVVETKTHVQDDGKPCRTEKQMTELCCEKKPALQCCEEKTIWSGYTAADMQKKMNLKVDKDGRDSDGRYINFVAEPHDGPCGEQVIKYDLKASNCCDQVDDVFFDREATPDILPAGGSVNLYVTGGMGPFEFTTSSNGTFFPDGRKTWKTYNRFVTLQAAETFCGGTEVTARDSCTVASMPIRSDIGSWQYIGADNNSRLSGSFVPCPGYLEPGFYPTTATIIFGNYKTTETIYIKGFSIGCPCIYSDAAWLDALCTALPESAVIDTCFNWQPFWKASGYDQEPGNRLIGECGGGFGVLAAASVCSCTPYAEWICPASVKYYTHSSILNYQWKC